MKIWPRFLALFIVMFVLSACTEIQLASHFYKKAVPPSQGSFKVGNPYKIAGRRYRPEESYDLVEKGIASWYGPNFHGKLTANGETFDMYELTAAHRTLQMPSIARVTNLENGRSLIVRINDRGPFAKNRVIDLSKRSADLLGMINQGTAKVKVEVMREESLLVADIAKSGRSTRGVEIALNDGREPEAFKGMRKSSTVLASSQQATIIQPQQVATIEPASDIGLAAPTEVRVEALPADTQQNAAYLQTQGQGGVTNTIPGHVKDGAFYPEQVVMEVPVAPSNIFVQAASFSTQDKALRLAKALSEFGQADIYPATVNGQQYYRVRIGPISDVNIADTVVAQIDSAKGLNSIIIVD